MVTAGGARCTTISPWRVSRASLCWAATRASAVVAAVVSGPEPRKSTSSPSSVAVTWMSSGLRMRLDRLGDRPGGGKRAIERRRKDRAAVDGDDAGARAARRSRP